MRRILPAFFSLLLASSTTIAQSVTKLSLKDCMDYAMKHNYNIKNAQLDLLIQKAQNDQTTAATYPHINGKVDFTDFDIIQKQFIEAKTFNPLAKDGEINSISFSLPYGASTSLTVSQLIFDGSVFVALKARNTVLDLARLNGQVTEENIRYNIDKAYNSLVIAYRQLDVIRSSLENARSMEHDLQVTRDNGFAEKIDVERMNVAVNNLATDSLRLSNFLTISENMLKYQIGMDINTKIVLTDTVLENRKKSAIALLTQEQNYERIPEFNLASTGLKLSELNLTRYKMSALPTLSAFWSGGYNYGALKFSDMTKFGKYMPNSTYGASLTMPIFNGFIRKYQIKETELSIEKAKNNIEFAKQSINLQLASSRTNLKNALLQEASQQRNLDLSTDVLDLAQKKYKAGVGSNLEVTQAQTDLLRSQNNYFSALLDIINAESDLKKALGLLK